MGGPTTTTNEQQNSSGQQSQQGINAGSTTSTPNLPAWLQSFYQGQPGQMNGLLNNLQGMANKPLYGQQQQTNFQQGLNQQLGQASQNINSQLASRGALNSNRASEAQTNLALGGARQMGDYLSQVPMLNQQYKQSVLGQYGNTLSNAMNYRPPVIGQTTDTTQLMNMLSNMNSQMSDNKTQQTSGGLMQSLLGGLLSSGMSALTGGLSGILGGGSFGQGASQALSTAPSSASQYQPPKFGPTYNFPQQGAPSSYDDLGYIGPRQQ